MIIVTQGHEQGIGLEVLLKSVLVSDDKLAHSLLFIGYSHSLETSLKHLQIPYQINEDSFEIAHRKVKARWLKTVTVSESFSSLIESMKICEEGNHLLFTLPTSKDQFPKGFSGHTEYFRHHYHLPELGMFFLSPDLKVLLLSDHIPLREVPELTEQIFIERIDLALNTLSQWKWPVERVLIAGINPHAGEGGLIGNEDSKLKSAIKKISNKHAMSITGPYPGDTMQLEQKSPNDLLIYPYHDQGLGIFKSLQGFVGANVTLGLKYPRFSPDHGTSFSLFGKNKADYRGCAYVLRQALKLSESLYGRNSRNQSTHS